MSLSDYKKKRDFGKTEEPEGGSREVSANRFVVQKHNASRLHFDFRLEMNDETTGEAVLKSWAVPKNVPLESGVKHLAIRTEDHPVEYLNFEGEIPQGNYGAGAVEIWDKGKWGLMKGSFKEKMLKFNLFGEKLKGRYVMIRTESYGKKKNDDNEYWLIWKKEV
jgi:DNA ligase D-like protein (predicted 3'-phosphoesterase)